MTGITRKITRRLAAEVREFRRWEACHGSDAIRIYYGMDHLPAPTEQISGGIVKCLDLAERFPNSPDKANLLYLVSSALPARRELLARAARRAGGRFVLNQNGVAYPAWAGPGWRKRNEPNARVHAMANYVVYQSEFSRRCAERFLGERKGPGEVLYNPVNTDLFSPKDGFDRSRHAPLLLIAGSHYDAYRVKTVIQALAIVRRHESGVRLAVAGRLVWGADAETEARRWGRETCVAEAVEFWGPYSQADAPALFRKADALVHLQVQDTCPRLVVEAMACGVPVVYSATGGVPELMGGEAGVGIPGEEDFEAIHPPSPESVAEAILKMLAEREKLARQARDRAVRLFSTRSWVEAHRRIFASLVERKT